MPILSRPAEVNAVNLFARTFTGEQALAIDLRFTAAEETALIVPLPVPQDGREDAVRFIPLHLYRPFFAHMGRGFEPRTDRRDKRREDHEDEEHLPRTVRFTSRVATRSLYVPSVAAFQTLCPEHVLPEALLSLRPEYADYGFAVFVLPAGDNVRIAPLGLYFRTSEPKHIYFPTFQYTGDALGSAANFDDTLYCQRAELTGWDETSQSAEAFVECRHAHGLVEPDRVIQRRVLYGPLENHDGWVTRS